MTKPARILYCHCTYAQVVPAEVKQAVLQQLAESGVAFDAVADLCELSAKRDPSLNELAAGAADGGTELRIAACYPRAVRWLFNAAGGALPEAAVKIANMRTDTAEQVVQALINGRPANGTSIAEAAAT
jgi:hypothetical protein